jgi:hypothetical protein
MTTSIGSSDRRHPNTLRNSDRPTVLFPSVQHAG